MWCFSSFSTFHNRFFRFSNFFRDFIQFEVFFWELGLFVELISSLQTSFRINLNKSIIQNKLLFRAENAKKSVKKST